jgi:quinol monooxygenase YgiN
VIRHVVLFQFTDAATPERIDRYERDLVEYVAGLEGVVSYRIGRDAGINPNTYDLSIVAEFDDETAFRRYFDGDRHLEIQRDTADMIAAKASSQSHVE